MFGWFRKKKVKEVKTKIVKTLVFRTEDKDVGYTLVKLKFLDSREFVTAIYGRFEQQFHFEDSKCGRSAYANEGKIVRSNEMAQLFIRDITGTYTQTYLDDPKNPNICMCGTVISAEILNTEEHMEAWNVAYVVEKEVTCE